LEGKARSFIIDNGKQFQKVQFNEKEYQFGWSRDMSAAARKRDLNPDMLLDAFVMFPPDAESPSCKAPQPEISCEPT